MGVYARAVPAPALTVAAQRRTDRQRSAVRPLGAVTALPRTSGGTARRHDIRPRPHGAAAHRACHVRVVAPSTGISRRGGRRLAAVGADGVFEPEVEGEEATQEGTPRWAQLIEALLDHGIDGAGLTSSAKELADKYEANPKYSTVEERVEALLRFEAAKSFAAGFLTGLGGVWTIPVAVPAAVYANWVLQARIAGAIAHMYGHDLRSTQVRTLCLMCLLGDNAVSVLKTMGVRVAEKAASKAINSIPTAVLVRLNKAVGTTLVVKCGKGGMIKLHRAVPLVGGVVAGSFDAGACMVVGRVAVRLFKPPPPGETDHDMLALDWAGTVDVEDYTVL